VKEAWHAIRKCFFSIWTLVFRISYVFAIVAMMVRSMAMKLLVHSYYSNLTFSSVMLLSI